MQALPRSSKAGSTVDPAAEHPALSPHQNGKQEVFWGQVEGRLIAMLEAEPNLTLNRLNQATQAWVEVEYHRGRHSETGQTPLNLLPQRPKRRPTGAADRRSALRLTKPAADPAPQRPHHLPERHPLRNPRPLRPLPRAHLRFAHWDLSHLWLVDQAERQLCRIFPLDKAANASDCGVPSKQLRQRHAAARAGGAAAAQTHPRRLRRPRSATAYLIKEPK